MASRPELGQPAGVSPAVFVVFFRSLLTIGKLCVMLGVFVKALAVPRCLS